MRVEIIGLTFDRVDLSSPVVHEIVVALHDILKFLLILRTLSHRHERLQTGRLHLRYNRPVPLSAKVRHDAHFPPTFFFTELRHRKELFDHGAYLTGVAIHDVWNE